MVDLDPADARGRVGILLELARKIPPIDDGIDEIYRENVRKTFQGTGDLKRSMSAALILRYLPYRSPRHLHS